MIAISLEEVAAATSGTLYDADPATKVTGVEIDSRNVVAGTLFAALPGERVDGVTFIAKALSQGAAGVLVPKGHAERDQWPGRARVEVADVQTALGKIAQVVRSRSAARIIGITGSSGKTTTKDMLKAVLTGRFEVIVNERSFNNELGVPLTLCRLEPETEVAVIEMGTAGAGQIAELCEIASPQVAVVTMIGQAHLDQFGSQDAIAEEKGALPASVPPDGLVVLNADDPRVIAMSARTEAQVITFSREAPATVRAGEITLNSEGKPGFGLTTPAGTAPVQLEVLGEHMVVNALAAAAVATGLGLDAAAIAEGLAQFRPSDGRMATRRRADGVLVIDDSYNANPNSVAAALKALAGARRPEGRTIAVLGTIGGMGELSDATHAEIGALAAELGIDMLLTVGPAARPALAAAQAGGLVLGIEVTSPAAVATVLEPVLAPDDTVLVKASHSEGLDQSVAALLAEKAPAPSEESRRVVVICGGPSTEHEVSLASAQSAVAQMQALGWDVLTAAVGKDGRWHVGPDALLFLLRQADRPKLPRQVVVGEREAVDFESFDGPPPVSVFAGYPLAFPLCHGQWGEDGTLQGLLVSYGLTVVGAGVAASAVCYDKQLGKSVLQASGIPVVASLKVSAREWAAEGETVTKRVQDALGEGPWFVKPVRGGSSIGSIGPVNAEELPAAVDSALRYDYEVLIEEFIPHRELMVGVLGNDELTVSPPLESVHQDDVLDYAAKYLRGQVRFAFPGALSAQQATELRELAVASYRALGIQGYCRIDAFLDTRSGRLLINEVNTLPGFSQRSAFSQLMGTTGWSYAAVLDELCRLATATASERAALPA